MYLSTINTIKKTLSLEFENCKKNDHLIGYANNQKMIYCANCEIYYDITDHELLAKRNKKNE